MRATPVRNVALMMAIVGPWAGVVVTGSLATAVGAPVQTSCHRLTANIKGETGKLTGCTTSTTGGAGVIQLNGKNNTDLVTWKNGGTTTVKFTIAKLVTPDACASGFTGYHSSGKVTASTGPASSFGGAVSALLCEPISLKGNVPLLPGTLFTF